MLDEPSSDPTLRHIRPEKDLYTESPVNDQQNLPVATRGAMAGANFASSLYRATLPQMERLIQSYAPRYDWSPPSLATPLTATITSDGPATPLRRGTAHCGQRGALPPSPPGHRPLTPWE
jgi:hypothetical protein